MKFNSKLLAITAIAAFCIIAIGGVMDDDADDGASVTYKIYLQLNDPTIDASATMWLPDYTADSASVENFVNAINSGLDKKGIVHEVLSTGWILNIYYDHKQYSTHGEWDYVSDYYSYAVYYQDGNKWVPSVSYNEGTTFAVVFDKYLWDEEYNALPDDEKAKYCHNDMGYASKLPVGQGGGGDFPIMYVVIAVVIVLIIALAVFFIRRRNA